jgi:hypothetical protein
LRTAAIVAALLVSGCTGCQYQALISAGSPGGSSFQAIYANSKLKEDIKYACMRQLGYTFGKMN